MREVWIKIVAVVILLAIIAGLTYGGYLFKRWINWKFSYEAKVEERVVPLEKRIGDLEERIRKLEGR